MKHYQFISLKDINAPYSAELAKAAADVINSGWYLHGENVKLFETELGEYCHVENVVTCSNGLDALRLIFKAYISLGIMKPGDEVIVPANTFIASVLAISDNGLIPVPAEPSPATHNLDIDKLEEYITPRTAAILVVHLYGTPCWSKKLMDIAAKHNLKIIEDNAQAIGAHAAVPGKSGYTITGSLGDAAAFSFYPTKNLGALGDAGAVITADKALAERVYTLANYGSDVRYHNPYCGLNCRMDEVQAAFLRIKLRHLDEITKARQLRARIYNENINNPKVGKPILVSGAVWHQYVVTVDDRENFRKYLSGNGVETDIHYPVPPHCQPCYANLSHHSLSIAESLANKVVSLPITESTPIADIQEISEIINGYK